MPKRWKQYGTDAVLWVMVIVSLIGLFYILRAE